MHPRSTAAPPVRRPVRSLAGALVAAVALVLTVLPATSGDAASSCDGVTVRVERSGSSTERCASGAPRNGLHALSDAGFRYTEVPGQAGMVCTIEGYPQACDGPPPSDAYWSYWHAEAGATSWTYAARGGGNRTPAPGSHDAWVFGSGAPPSSPPPSPPAPSRDDDGAGSGDGGGSEGSGGATGASSGSSGGSGSSGSTSGTGGSGGSGSSGGSGGSSGSGGRGDVGTSSEGGSVDSAATDDSSRSEGPAADDGSDGDAPVEGTTSPDDEDDREGTPGDTEPGAAEDDPAEGAEPIVNEEALLAQPERLPAAIEGDVEVPAGAGGRSSAGVVAGSTLVLGLAAAGLLRARRRTDDPGLGT